MVEQAEVQASKLEARAKEAAKRRKRTERNREFVNALKSAPCTDCGVSYPPFVMDFDHVRQGKRCDVSDLVAKGRSLSLIIAEVSLCELVCANCHRVRSHSRAVDQEVMIDI